MSLSGAHAVGLTALSLVSFLPSLAAQPDRQVDTRAPESASAADRQVPGALPGTLRYLVTLRTQSYDLRELQRAIAQKASAAEVDAIVARFDAAAKGDQKDVVAKVTELGGQVHTQWWLVNALAVDLRPEQVAALRAHPHVLHLVPDEIRRPGIKTATNANNHGTDLVQRFGYRGSGTTIAILDSGLDMNMAGTGRPHATFYVNGDVNNRTGGGVAGSRVLAAFAMGSMGAEDTINHGTPVAGVAGGARWNSTAVADDGHAPDAKLVSYGLAIDAAGGTTGGVLTSTWQRLVTDKVSLGITVANCSYEGTFDERWPDQIAIQNTALVADILIAGMAGNGGTNPVAYGYAATNMLAVGACQNDTRELAAFSQRAPQVWFLRTYPDLIANGVGITAPSADAEAQSRWGQGTSYSSPQVAGAAALYRGARPSATALECRAAILATTEDVTARQQPPDRTRNAIGHGYLRVDWLMRAALNPLISTTGTLNPSTLQASYSLPVTAGLSYGIAASWFRTNFTSVGEIDLQLRRGATVIASAAATDNVEEVIRYTATANESLSVVVLARNGLSGAQTFALVATEARMSIPGRFTTFGSGCGLPIMTPNSPAPQIGRPYDILCSPTGGFPLYPLFMMLGVDRTQHAGLPLPADLTQLGAPGCALHISPMVFLQVPYNTMGGSTPMSLPLPNELSMLGQRIYHQLARVAPDNALGLSTSAGLEALIGGNR